jgi:hypothetical protein
MQGREPHHSPLAKRPAPQSIPFASERVTSPRCSRVGVRSLFRPELLAAGPAHSSLLLRVAPRGTVSLLGSPDPPSRGTRAHVLGWVVRWPSVHFAKGLCNAHPAKGRQLMARLRSRWPSTAELRSTFPYGGSSRRSADVARRHARTTPPTSIPQPRWVPRTGPTCVQNSGAVPKIAVPWATRCSASSEDWACCTIQSVAPRSCSSSR